MRRLSQILAVSCILLGYMYSCNPKPSKKEINSQETKADPVKLNVDEFEKKLNATPNAQLVDVRTPEEYDKGHLKGSLNINYQGESFSDEVAKLDKNKPTFVYCHSGGRSSEASKYMSNQGFKEVYDMENGMSAWAHYNKPVEIKSE
jgi:thioredoxin 1